MNHATAILSMLHEPADHNSATRQFRGTRVLQWTLDRLARCTTLSSRAILCWEDQLPQLASLADDYDCHVLAKGPRVPIPAVDAIAAAQRWSDGWRGGLLGTCDFDLGFHGPWVREVIEHLDADAAVLVDPASALVDPALVDQLVRTAREQSKHELIFAQAAPGLAGVLVKKPLVEQLAASGLHPGRLLHYLPARPTRDAIATEAAIPVATAVARSLQRFKLDSDRQLRRIDAATVSLNGTLVSTAAEQLVLRAQASPSLDPLPRELVLELTTARSSRPIFAAATHLPVARAPMTLEVAKPLLDALAVADDARLVLGGHGDPLRSDAVLEVVAHAKQAGIRAIAIETDLLDVTAATLEALAELQVDVISVHLPGLSAATYAAVMGVDRYAEAIENVKRLLQSRQRQGRGVPIVVPTFTKCRVNLAEMEAWYDQWLTAVGTAVICGPSTFGGRIPDAGVADMSPPKRVACRRLSDRMTVHSDGSFATCEEDPLGLQSIGSTASQSLGDAWRTALQPIRAAHRCGNVAAFPACATCREWHRP
jgi:hypothetical protein